MGSILSDPKIWGIVFLSLKVSALAMLVVVPLAVVVARWLAKPGLRGKALLSALVHLPLVLPPVVTGYGLLLIFGRRGWVGSYLDQFGISFMFSWTGAALAAGLMAFPLVVRPIRLAFETQDSRLEDIAATLGASRWRRFVTIALPLAWPGVLAGLVLGFAKALGEFGATITFVSNIPYETQTLSLAIYTLLQSPSGDRAAITLIGISICLSFLAILASEWTMVVMERKRER
ncbi:MAG: molybdate ABC transporter permease subunit [Rhizobiaceae bacterium]